MKVHVIFLTLLTGCCAVSRKLAKSTKADTKAASTKAPKSTKAPLLGDSIALYGLQDDCHEDDPDEFNICLNLLSTSGKYEDWMDTAVLAKERWENVIAKDTVEAFDVTSVFSPTLKPTTPSPSSPIPPSPTIPPISVPIPTPLENFLTSTEGLVPDLVDDLYIYIREIDISVLSVAAALAVENVMRTDLGDPRNVAYTLSAGILFNMEMIDEYGLDLETIILHEIGHVLGFGDTAFIEMTDEDLDGNKHYVGTEGLAQWYKLGCTGKLPLDFAGSLSPGIHFGDCLGKELMTEIGSGSEKLLSAITLGILADVGYSINFGEADDFTIDDLGTCAIDFCDTSKRKLAPDPITSQPPLSDSSWDNIYQLVLEMSPAELVFIEYVQDGLLYSVQVRRDEALAHLANHDKD